MKLEIEFLHVDAFINETTEFPCMRDFLEVLLQNSKITYPLIDITQAVKLSKYS